jgi:hypothetical protein
MSLEYLVSPTILQTSAISGYTFLSFDIIRAALTIAAQTFLETYRPDINPNTTFDFLSVDDGINNQLPADAGEDGVSSTSFLTLFLLREPLSRTRIFNTQLPSQPESQLHSFQREHFQMLS